MLEYLYLFFPCWLPILIIVAALRISRYTNDPTPVSLRSTALWGLIFAGIPSIYVVSMIDRTTKDPDFDDEYKEQFRSLRPLAWLGVAVFVFAAFAFLGFWVGGLVS